MSVKIYRSNASPPQQHVFLAVCFQHEAKGQAGFSHPKTIPFDGYGEIHGMPYLVMASSVGGILENKLKGLVHCQWNCDG